MSDATLRRLSRQAATGDVEAQARQLLERVRSGSLTRERLELAAWGGHEAARLNIGAATPWALGKHGFASDWATLDGLSLVYWWNTLWLVFRNGPGPGPAGWVTFRGTVEAASAALFFDLTQEEREADLGGIVRTARQLLEAPCVENLALLRATVAAAKRAGFVPSWAMLDGCFTEKRGLVSRDGCEAVVFFASARTSVDDLKHSVREALVSWSLGP